MLLAGPSWWRHSESTGGTAAVFLGLVMVGPLYGGGGLHATSFRMRAYAKASRGGGNSRVRPGAPFVARWVRGPTARSWRMDAAAAVAQVLRYSGTQALRHSVTRR